MNERHEVERVAYELYQRDGCNPGRELDHWIEAEKIVQARKARTFITKSLQVKKAVSAAVTRKKVVEKSDKTASSKESRKNPIKKTMKKSGTSQKETAL